MTKKNIVSIIKIAILMIVCIYIYNTPQIIFAGNTLVWPVPGHTATSRGYTSSHHALDISDSNINGAKIVAAYGGTVVRVYTCSHNTYPNMYNCCYGFGTGVVIKGTDGRFYQYAHMTSGSVPSNIYAGASVSAGQVIGAVGSTGNSTGPHLHFGISVGENYYTDLIDPALEQYSDGASPSVTFSNTYTTDITETSAKIYTDYTMSSTMSDCGFYLGTSNNLSSMTKTSEYKYGGTPHGYTYGNNSYKLGTWYDNTTGYKWSQPLSPGTTYYYAFYNVVGGKEFISDINSFTTLGTAASVTFSNTYTTDITETSAKIYTDYTMSSTMSDCGFYFGTSNSLSSMTKTSEYKYGGTPHGYTYGNNSYKLGTWYDNTTGYKWSQPLTPGTTYYYAFYNVVGGKEFITSIYSFTTVASTPTVATKPLVSISLNKTDVKLKTGERASLSVSYNPSDTTDSKSISWSSSNSNVATISNGTITAKSAGTAVITANCNGKTAKCSVTVTSSNEYVGDVNTELQNFRYDASNGYLSGQIVVVEWIDTNGDGIKESTVPKYAPKMQFVSTDGTETIDVYVTATGTNTYYFDRKISGLTKGKEYVFKVTSGNPYNTSKNKTVPIYTGSSSIGSSGKLGMVGTQEIAYNTSSDGTLRLYGTERSGYVGNVNSLLTNVNYGKSTYGDFITGNIVITEWIGGSSTVPKTTPKMTFESVDGTEVNEVFMKCLDGTNTYYFDRNLNGRVNTSKEYIFRVTLTESDNISANKSMVVTTNEMNYKSGILWETDTQVIRYRTVWANNDNQLRVYAVNK